MKSGKYPTAGCFGEERYHRRVKKTTKRGMLGIRKEPRIQEIIYWFQ